MIYNLPLSVKYLLPNQHLGLVLLNKNHTLCETFWLACSVYVCCAYVKLILLLKHHWIFQAVNYFSLRGTCFIWQYNKNINISANGGKIFCREPNQYPKIFEDFMRCSKLFIPGAFLLKSDIFYIWWLRFDYIITIKKQFFVVGAFFCIIFQTLEVKKGIRCPELFTDDPHLGMISN